MIWLSDFEHSTVCSLWYRLCFEQIPIESGFEMTDFLFVYASARLLSAFTELRLVILSSVKAEKKSALKIIEMQGPQTQRFLG